MLASACAGEPQPAVDQAACETGGALVDLVVMHDAIKASMAYPAGGGASADEIFAALQERAAAAKTETEHLRVLESFVYALGDHHAHLGTNDRFSPRLVPSGATVWAESRNGKIVITEVRRGSPARAAGLREGMTVEAIDGVATADALKPPPSRPEHAAEMRGFAARVALAGTHEKDTVVRAQDGERVLEATLGPMPDESGSLASLSFPRPEVALVRINNSLGNADLPDAFGKLLTRAKDAKALILDLRNTPSGGDSSIAKPLMAWFVKGRRGYQKHQRGDRTWIEQVDGRRDHFDGRLIVLVDHWTGSMGEGTAIGLRSAAGALLVGTRMAGLRGAIESFNLPCLGASVRLPVERLYSVEGTPRELAVPDVEIGEAELAAAGEEDAVLGRALAMVR
jgi:carboxyl-terminal processing protease